MDEDPQVQSWFNLQAEGNLALRLGMYRVNWPSAYRYIVQADGRAHDIARERGWIEEDKPVDASEAGIAGNLVKLEKLSRESPVAAALASLGLSFLRKAVASQAPDKLHLIPDTLRPMPPLPVAAE